MPNEVTDPAVLAQLNGQEITDPTVLAQPNNGPVDMNRPLQNNPFANQGFGANYALGAGQLISNIGTAAQERWAHYRQSRSLGAAAISDRFGPAAYGAAGSVCRRQARSAHRWCGFGRSRPWSRHRGWGSGFRRSARRLTPTTGNESVTDNTLMGRLARSGKRQSQRSDWELDQRQERGSHHALRSHASAGRGGAAGGLARHESHSRSTGRQ